MRFRDWIEKSGKTPRGESEVEANRKLRQPGTGNWWGYFNFGIVVLAVWQKNQKKSWKKQEKAFLKPEAYLCWTGSCVEPIWQIFQWQNFRCFLQIHLRKTGNVSSLVNRKLSRIILTNFSDVFFEKKPGKAFVKPEAFSWVNWK